MRATSSITPGFPGLSQSLGHVAYVLLRRSPLSPKAPFDLHVLGTPPAFVLSHDQTLRRNVFIFPFEGICTESLLLRGDSAPATSLLWCWPLTETWRFINLSTFPVTLYRTVNSSIRLSKCSRSFRLGVAILPNSKGYYGCTFLQCQGPGATFCSKPAVLSLGGPSIIFWARAF